MNVRQFIQKSLMVAMAAVLFSACSMMSDDLSDCPTGLYVNFVYDYNIQRADMFKDHVGGLTLYVYDETDRLVTQRTVSGDDLSRYGYYVHFTEQELAPGHHYRLQALAMQKDWTAALSTPGAKYRRTDMQTGSSRTDLAISLDRTATRLASDYREVSATAPLDTLWHTLTTISTDTPDHPAKTQHRERADGTVTDNGQETFLLEHDLPTYATVSLIRDTKHLNISLHELDTPGDVSADDYEVFILDDNGDLDYANRVVAPSDSLVYRPYAQWTATFQGDGEIPTERTAHFDLMFNRLRYNTNTNDNALLCIRRRSTGTEVAVINLPYILSEGRTAYEIYSYSPQEYLDREYDYRLEFFLRGDRWLYVSVCIDVLSWAKRIQYVEFK